MYRGLSDQRDSKTSNHRYTPVCTYEGSTTSECTSQCGTVQERMVQLYYDLVGHFQDTTTHQRAILSAVMEHYAYAHATGAWPPSDLVESIRRAIDASPTLPQRGSKKGIVIESVKLIRLIEKARRPLPSIASLLRSSVAPSVAAHHSHRQGSRPQAVVRRRIEYPPRPRPMTTTIARN